MGRAVAMSLQSPAAAGTDGSGPAGAPIIQRVEPGGLGGGTPTRRQFVGLEAPQKNLRPAARSPARPKFRENDSCIRALSRGPLKGPFKRALYKAPLKGL